MSKPYHTTVKQSRHQVKLLCEEWAEDHTYLQCLCKEVGYSEDEVEGDSYGVPGIQQLAKMLRDKITK